MEQNDPIEQISDAVTYLKRKPYGLFYGDNFNGMFELDWYESSKEVFESALGTVETIMLDSEDLSINSEEELSINAKNSIEGLREKFASEGLSEKLLEDINQYFTETEGFGWWGTFEQLKQGDGSVHGDLLRCSFRENDNSQPITDDEQEAFAKWVTRYPLDY